MRPGRILLIFIAAMVFACREKISRVEGIHDSVQTALDLAADRTIQGNFARGQSVVYFRVKLNQATMLRGELTAARGADSSITVFHPPGNTILAVDDNGSSLAEEIPPVYLTAGETVIRIEAKSEEPAEYRFFYRTFNAPTDVEQEPNNSAATANPITGLHAAGFHGPQYFLSGREKLRERDCFSKQNTASEPVLVSAKLTGVDGITGSVAFLDMAGNEIYRQDAADIGHPLETSPVFLPASAPLVVCVSSARPQRPATRDYYELTLSMTDIMRKSEIEPNNTAATATRISEDTIAGQITTITDMDFLSYVNKREYPVIVNVSLESAALNELRLVTARDREGEIIFEDSAAKNEIAENIRLDAGEKLTLSVRVRPKIKKKDFKPAAYTIKINESQFNDDNESENNGTPERADLLVDHAQKWGFINPPGDIDYYRLGLEAPGERVLVFESKIACKIRLEHLRQGKPVAIMTGIANVKYPAGFQKDDLVRLSCVGQKPNPAERAYRLALTEP